MSISFAVRFSSVKHHTATPATTQKLSYFGRHLHAAIVLCDEKGQRPDLAEYLSQKTYKNIFEIVQAILTEHADTLFLSPQRGYIPRQLTESFLSFDRLRVPNKLSMELSSLASDQTAEELLHSCAEAIHKDLASYQPPILRLPADILARVFHFLPKGERTTVICKKFKDASEKIYKQKLMTELALDPNKLDDYIDKKFSKGTSYQHVYGTFPREARDFLALMEKAYQQTIDTDPWIQTLLGDTYVKGFYVAQGLEPMDAIVKATSWIQQIDDRSFDMGKFAKNVTQIPLSFAKLCSLHPKIGDFKNVVEINLAQNRLTSLPSELATCISLKKLNLTANCFKELPPVIYSCKNLALLTMNDNQISEVAQKVALLTALEVFNISENPLKKISKEITSLKQLHTFSFLPNDLETIDQALFSFHAFRKCYLINIGTSISNKQLELVEAHISKIPERIQDEVAIGCLTKLIDDDTILKRGLHALDRLILQPLNCAEDRLLKHLFMKALGPDEYSKVKAACKSNYEFEVFLREIKPKLDLLKIATCLEKNLLPFDSPFVARLFSDLKYLFTNYPKLLINFSTLKKLFESNKQSIGKIKVLDLSSMNLMDLPDEIILFKGLEELFLEKNFFTAGFPEKLLQLKNLRKINLRSCHIPNLPAEIEQLDRLNELDLTYNPLTSLPHALVRMKNLARLAVDSNKLLDVPLELLETNRNILISYIYSIKIYMIEHASEEKKWMALIEKLPDQVKKTIDLPQQTKSNYPEQFISYHQQISKSEFYHQRLDDYVRQISLYSASS
ncbi:MAG: leucine-rich repeat domain-containing protein [Anaerolineae bacterium]